MGVIMTMLQKIKNFFTQYRQIFESLKDIKDSLSRMDMFSSLPDYEKRIYTSAFSYLHNAYDYVDRTVTIVDNYNNILYTGHCIGFGTVINNAIVDSKKTTNKMNTVLRKFLVLRINDDDAEKVVTIENNMKVKIMQ